MSPQYRVDPDELRALARRVRGSLQGVDNIRGWMGNSNDARWSELGRHEIVSKLQEFNEKYGDRRRRLADNIGQLGDALDRTADMYGTQTDDCIRSNIDQAMQPAAPSAPTSPGPTHGAIHQ